MRSRNTARVGLVGSVIGVATMALAAVAFACTNLATLNLGVSSGAPGSAVTVTGSSFASTTKGAGPVVLHLNSATAPALATAVPDASGAVSTTFTVPADAQPGYAVIVATQQGKDGSASFGTPARASFLITGNGAAPVAAQPAPQSGVVNTVGQSSSTGILALTIGLGVLGLALFGAGLASYLRQSRRRETPVPARVRGE